MIFSGKNKAILFLKSNGFYFFDSSSNNLLSCPLSPDLLKDYDVLNREKLQMQINTFLKTSKIAPANIVIVLPETVYFDKDIFTKDESKQREEIQTFLDSVPIENVHVGKIKLEKGQKVIVVNKDLYNAVKDAFEDHGSEVVAGIPYFILQQFGINALLDFDLNTAGKVLKNFDRLHQYNLFSKLTSVRHEATHEEHGEPVNGSKLKVNKNLLYLSAVFGVLLIVLIVMLISNSSAPQTTSVKAGSPSPTSAVRTNNANVSPSPQPTNEIDQENSVLIRNSSGDPQKAISFRNRLTALGFEAVELDNVPLATSSTTLVVFAREVSSATRNLIFTELRQQFSNVALEEGSETETDILINLGRPL